MTENTENPRAALARAHLAAALTEAGVAAPLARYVASGAEIVSTAGSGCLLEVNGVRALDTEESLAALARSLVAGPVVTAGAPVDDAAASEAARAAGKAAGAAARAALQAGPLAFE